jgi:hypothetical protein
MATKDVNVQVGPNFLGLLTIVFITLKLTGYIAWSWWWVLSPLWIGFVAAITIFLIIATIAGLFK